jgi:ABC-type antimicrobial peptide transport system permease subunit
VRPTWVLGSTRFLVRATADPAALAPLLRRLIPAQDPRMSVLSLVSGPELVSRSLVRERMVATLFVTFGVLAVGLACVGLYGLIAHHVVQHTNEIGIRMALGAQRGDVLQVLLRRAVVWIVSGVALGVPLALSVSRVAQGLLFGLSGTDAGALLTAAGLVTAMGLLAAFLPAVRALRLDPLTALRAD